MAKQKYLWIVEKKIGSWASWVAKGRKGPMPNSDGVLKFGKGEYPVDPKKFRPWVVPKGLKKGETVKIQIWQEDIQTPLDFFAEEKKVGNEFTAGLLHRISQIKRLELSRVNKDTDKVVMMLALALIISIGVIGVLAYLVVNK